MSNHVRRRGRCKSPIKSRIRREAMGKLPILCECGNHASVLLTKGYVALISPQDIDLVSAYGWNAQPVVRNVYAKCSIKPEFTGCVFLHRLLLDHPTDKWVDHINHNGLDCRRENMRLCDGQQNAGNRRPQLGRKSRFKGVNWCPRKQKWYPRIKVDGKARRLGGHFKSDTDAALVYDEAARKCYGEFAHTNFPTPASS